MANEKRQAGLLQIMWIIFLISAKMIRSWCFVSSLIISNHLYVKWVRKISYPFFQSPFSFLTYIRGVPLCVIIKSQILTSFLGGCAGDATSYEILWQIRPIFRLDDLLKKSDAALLCVINVISTIRVFWKNSNS